MAPWQNDNSQELSYTPMKPADSASIAAVLATIAEKKAKPNLKHNKNRVKPKPPKAWRQGDYGHFNGIRKNFPTSFFIFCTEQ